MKRILWMLAAVAGPVLWTLPVRADLIVSPTSRTTSEGNTFNNFPFAHGDEIRYQQAYSMGAFDDVNGELLISAIRFRPDKDEGNAFSANIPDIMISMSTTTQAVNGLSATFANNVGADNTVVYDRDSLSLSSADTGGPPRDFDVVINFDTPFLYDPAEGNLLLDIHLYNGTFTTRLDAHNNANDQIARVFSTDVDAGAGTKSTIGLVTEFDYETVAVPSPGATMLGGLGLMMLGGIRRRSSN